MGVTGSDWPSALSEVWEARKQSGADVDHTAQIEGLIALIGGMYRDQDIKALASAYVQQATAADCPAWAAAGRSVWALGLWRKGEEDAALLQLILSELALQEELRAPRPQPVGGPTGPGAAHNNLGVAYAALEMFELAEPHLERASEISQREYGPALALQTCADRANLAEIRVRWALFDEAVGSGHRAEQLALRAREDSARFSECASTIGRDDAVRFARMLDLGVRSMTEPTTLNKADRDQLLADLDLPVFGDEPGEVLMRAVAARVCRIVGDPQGCWDQAARVSAMNRASYHASTIIALHEAALAEGTGGHTWRFASAVAEESEATRRRIVTAFQARLGLAGLEQRYQQVSLERRTLQLALQEALRQEAELVHAATHDSLTGLPNRALFEQQLSAALGEMRDEQTCAVAYVDVDDFKAVNDTYGHSAGDRVLRWLGERLRTVVGDSDTVARLGGDEFAVLLRRADQASVDRWHEEFVAEVRHAPFDVTFSVGLCFIGQEAATVEDILHRADIEMYEVKRRRKADRLAHP